MLIWFGLFVFLFVFGIMNCKKKHCIKQASKSPMASTSTQIASSSSSSTPQWRYEVFLSFFGKDTRNSFTDHLYAALKDKGIKVFRDNEELERGKKISELLKAIQESTYAIVVISANYASSRWCLMELAEIVQCMKGTGRILPIFYHVDPSDVRKQTGSFAEALAKHEKDRKFDTEMMPKWTAAFKEVGNIAGWHLHDGPESIVVKEIGSRILNGLSRNFSVSKDFVGIESRVEEIMTLLSIESDDVRFLGIYGMGGVGKTTLSRVIDEIVSPQFEASCFISNIREETRTGQGLLYLQKQLISKIIKASEINISVEHEAIKVIANRLRNKKVFIVLDDVDEVKQLEALAKSHDWFGQGSRIIITSRDRHLLDIFVNNTFEVKVLNGVEALRLFSLKAFKKHHPEENYVKLSMDIVNYAQGLPLALEVFGSFLFGRTLDKWESARDFLKENPNAEILDKLKISFDGLEDLEKNLFLDIACFFNGAYIDSITHILKSMGYYPEINIEVLKDKSLITTSWGRLWMHDLLQKLGQNIVRCESTEEPGRRSRLWHYKDVLHVMKNNTGTDAVKGIVLNVICSQKQELLNVEAFSTMTKLKWLQIKNNWNWNCNRHGDPPNFMLSNELCFIEWPTYPLESLPTSFQSDNLVKLVMHRSNVKQLWDGSKSFVKLKRIDLSSSLSLIETPDLSEVPNLEELILKFCKRLSKVHPSIEFLRRLKRLDLQFCKRLETLPDIGSTILQVLDLTRTAIKRLPLSITSLSSLKELILSDCSRLEEIPKDLSGMECLEVLKADSTSIRELPSSIVFLKKLRVLDVARDFQFGSPLIPNSFSGLSSLQRLALRNCRLSDGAIPSDLSCLSSLVELDLSGNKFRRLPDISQLSHLCKLNLDYCSWLQVLPKLPLKLGQLKLRYCPSLEMFYNQMDMWTSNEKLRSIDCTFMADYIDYDGKPSKILHLHPRSPIWINQGPYYQDHYFYNKAVCGPALLGFGIPEWFKDKSTTDFDLYSDEFKGYALFIVYQVHDELDTCPKKRRKLKEHEHGSSSSRILEHEHELNFPYFLFQFQANGVDLEDDFEDDLVPGDRSVGFEDDLVLCVPGDRSVGPSGFWVYIPTRWFKANAIRSLWKFWNNKLSKFKVSITKASITAGSQNVEVKEWGARVVRQHDVLEFYQVLNSISPHGLDLQSYDNLFFHSDNRGARVVRQHDVSEFNQVLHSISPHGLDLQSYRWDNGSTNLTVHGPIKGKEMDFLD